MWKKLINVSYLFENIFYYSRIKHKNDVVDNTKYEANLVILVIPNVLSEKKCTIFRPNQ